MLRPVQRASDIVERCSRLLRSRGPWEIRGDECLHLIEKLASGARRLLQAWENFTPDFGQGSGSWQQRPIEQELPNVPGEVARQTDCARYHRTATTDHQRHCDGKARLRHGHRGAEWIGGCCGRRFNGRLKTGLGRGLGVDACTVRVATDERLQKVMAYGPAVLMPHGASALSPEATMRENDGSADGDANKSRESFGEVRNIMPPARDYATNGVAQAKRSGDHVD